MSEYLQERGIPFAVALAPSRITSHLHRSSPSPVFQARCFPRFSCTLALKGVIMASAPFFLAVNYPWLNYGRDFGISPGLFRHRPSRNCAKPLRRFPAALNPRAFLLFAGFCSAMDAAAFVTKTEFQSAPTKIYSRMSRPHSTSPRNPDCESAFRF